MERQPNILFVFSDQQHWQAVGCVDASFDTPNLNRLAAGDGSTTLAAGEGAPSMRIEGANLMAFALE